MRTQIFLSFVVFFTAVVLISAAASESSIDSASLAINSVRSSFTCVSDSDCSNQGTCLSSGTCSCFSGFGDSNAGYDCAVLPSSSCSSSYHTNISSSSSSFDSTFSFLLSDNILSVNVVGHLDQNIFTEPWTSSSAIVNSSTTVYSLDTLILFNNNSTACNYPPSSSSSAWTKMAAGIGSTACVDKYEFSMSWSDAQDKCGFSYDSEDNVWYNSVTVIRKYSIPFGKNVTQRTESQSFEISIRFPSEVDVGSQVTVSGPSSVTTSALAQVEYLSDFGYWQIDVQTYTRKPYQLSAPSVAMDGYADRILDSTALYNMSPCNSNDLGCSQKISVFISNCSALTGNLVITTSPVCSGGASSEDCASINGNVIITVNLDTAISCTLIDSLNLQTKALNVYSSPYLNSTGNNFTAAQTAYFAATILSTDAKITDRTISSVCMILNPQLGNENCVNVSYNVLTSTDSTKDPVFSVSLAQTRSFTNSTDVQIFRFQVTIGLTWSFSTKRDALYANTATVVDITIQPTVSSTTSHDSEQSSHTIAAESADQTSLDIDSSWKVAVIAVATSIGILLIVVAVVFALVIRRKRQKRAAEEGFNFSNLS